MAFELANEKFRVSGFGTLAATSAGNDELRFYSTFTQPPQSKDWSLETDSVLGVQFDLNLTSQLDASLQLVSKDRSKNGLEESIEWAYIKYQPRSDTMIRAGRLGADIYMLSEYRHVSFAYLWIRPVVEFYTPVVFTHFDGLDVSYTHRLSSGFLQYKLFSGQVNVDFNQEDSSYPFELSDIYGFNILFETQQWKARATVVTAKIGDTEDPSQQLQDALNSVPATLWPEAAGIANDLKAVNKRLSFYSIGIAYDQGWQVQSELSLIDSKWAFYPSLLSAYISFGKRFKAFTPYGTLSRVKMKESMTQINAPLAPALLPLHLQLTTVLSAAQIDQHTVSLGVRWDVQPRVALKAQWDHSRINDNKSSMWNRPVFPVDKDTMDTFSISLSFIF